MRYRSALLACGLSFGGGACGSADLYELDSITPTPNMQQTSPTQNEDPFHWVVVETGGLSGRENNERIEQWFYDEKRLLGSEEIIPCRCIEEPRSRFTHRYSEREIVSTEDRDIDGTVDNTLRYEFDASRRLVRFTNNSNRGYEVVYTYDEDGQLMQTQSLVDGVTSASRNEAGLLTAIYSGRTPSHSWSYDADGRLIQELSHNYPNHYEFTYNDQGQVQTQRYYRPGQFNSVTSYEYDDEGRVTYAASQDETGAVVVEHFFSFDEEGRLLSNRKIDHRSTFDNETHYTYNEQGRLLNSEQWSGRVLQSTTEYRWAQLRTGDVQLTTIRDEEPTSAYRRVFRRLEEAPITPPKLPQLNVAHPTPKLPNVAIVLP